MSHWADAFAPLTIPSTNCTTRKKPRQLPVPLETWLTYKDWIHTLYIVQKRTLPQVLEDLRKYGFTPSRRQLVTQLDKWRMHKYRRAVRPPVSEAGRHTGGSPRPDEALTPSPSSQRTSDYLTLNYGAHLVNSSIEPSMFPQTFDDFMQPEAWYGESIEFAGPDSEGCEQDSHIVQNAKKPAISPNRSMTTSRGVESPAQRQPESWDWEWIPSPQDSEGHQPDTHIAHNAEDPTTKLQRGGLKQL